MRCPSALAGRSINRHPSQALRVALRTTRRNLLLKRKNSHYMTKFDSIGALSLFLVGIKKQKMRIGVANIIRERKVMKRRSLEAIFAAVALVLGTGVAHAQLSGPKSIQAFGGAIDGSEDGHMALAGTLTLTPKGGARAVNVTLVYQDEFNDADSFVCSFTQPEDVTYKFSGGTGSAGHVTFQLSPKDPHCYQMINPSNTVSEAGATLTFAVYAHGNDISLVGLDTSLVDVDADQIDSPVSLSGTLSPAPKPAQKLTGVHVLNAFGGVTDSNGDGGHMAIGGLITVTPKGQTKSLDVALSYTDSAQDNFVCHMTNTNDLSYNISHGVGTLTLTPNASDTNCKFTAGRSIRFSVWSAGANSWRILSTSSSLHDPLNDVIDSVAITGTM
jgi:hypothetical protein